MRLALSLIVPALLSSAPTTAQAASPSAAAAPAAQPFDKADAATAVTALASALEDFYTYPAPGKAYATALRSRLASGAYARFDSREAFARMVTADLQAVHKDEHLRLQAITPDEQSGARDLRGFSDASAVTKAGWIADGVAYIAFSGLPGNEATLADVRAFLATHKDAKTLIIDERNNRGGGVAEMNLLFPQIFAEPTVLVDMDTRLANEQAHGSPPNATDSMRKIAGPEGVVRREHFVTPAPDQGGLAHAAVYLLVSHHTASAGEHLALALKRTHRATLIGEATAGADHFGAMVPMSEGYVAYIPVGRTFDPDTGEDWEGVGVKPDVAVPADTALDVALARAGVRETAVAALSALK